MLKEIDGHRRVIVPGSIHYPRSTLEGYNVSQLWDTAFAVQAILSTNLAEECYTTLKKAHSFINKSQVLDDCPVDLSYWYRHISEGVWPFSTADHGWPISDCTPEGLKLPSGMVGEPIEAKRLYAIVNVILSLQPSSCSTSDHQNKNVKPMRILLSRVANHVSHDKEVVKELQRMATHLKALPTSRSRIVTGFGYSYLWEVRVGEPWHRQV